MDPIQTRSSPEARSGHAEAKTKVFKSKQTGSTVSFMAAGLLIVNSFLSRSGLPPEFCHIFDSLNIMEFRYCLKCVSRFIRSRPRLRLRGTTRKSDRSFEFYLKTTETRSFL
jgi:hypothetical protein